MKRTMLALFALVAAMLQAQTLNLTVNFPHNKGDYRYTKQMTPGDPKTAVYPVKIVLPAGTVPDGLEITMGQTSSQRGYVDYARKPQPTEQSLPDNTKPNPQVYQHDALYPATSYKVLGVQRYRGYDLLLVNLYPQRYNPVKNASEWSEKAEINLQCRPDTDIAANQQLMLRQDQYTLDMLQRIAINPTTCDTYRRGAIHQSRTLLVGNPVNLVIITPRERFDWYAPYLTQLQSQGITAATYATQDIYAQYAGADNAAKIRNFVTDCYQTWAGSDTSFDYVLLGGDTESVPIRGVYCAVWDTIDNALPCDIYFSNLDGSWDGNNNGVYGETNDNVDMLPEVSIGRFSAETQSAVANLINKSSHYTNTTNYTVNMACMIGEQLNNNPVTWGGDYKDDVARYMPAGYTINHLYQRDGNFSSVNVLQAINDGTAIINHMGHSNETMVMGLSGGSVSSFTNTEYGFVYSQGCYAAALDLPADNLSECIAERLVNGEHGLYAFVGNTRYGWYSPGSIDGPSEYYDRDFFAGLYNQNLRRLGQAQDYSRMQLVNEALSDETMLWVYYELVIFGDPTVAVKSPVNDFPMLTVGNARFSDINGDNDGQINPGEPVSLFVDVINQEGWSAAANVVGTLTAEPGSGVTIVNGTVNYGPLPAGQSASSPTVTYSLTTDPASGYTAHSVTLTLSSELASGAQFSRSYKLNFETTLWQKGWPATYSIPSNIGPVALNFDSDQELELAQVYGDGDIDLFDSDGTSLYNYSDGKQYDIRGQAAASDLNGDGVPEIITASRESWLRAFNPVTRTMAWSDSLGGMMLLTPVVANFTGDSAYEIAVSNLRHQFIFIRANGGVIPTGFSTNDMVLRDFAAADMDGDGLAEVIYAASDSTLCVSKADGTMLPGFPVHIGAIPATSPIVTDEGVIVLGTNNRQLVMAGSDWARWIDLPGSLSSAPIALNWDYNPGAELAFVTGGARLYVVDTEGNIMPGFPVTMPNGSSQPPLAADVNNDGRNELIVLDYFSNLMIYDHNGTLLPYTPVTCYGNGNNASSVADMDNDGDLEIIGSSSNSVFAYDIKTTAGAMINWPTYRGNLRRTGAYSDIIFTPATDQTVVPSRTTLLGNYPNPFNPSTTISYQLSAPSRVKLAIYNVRGQLVKTLADEPQTAGKHSVSWNGTDNAGRGMASGVYFYRLQGNGVNQVKKALLLK